eukprot:6922577-Prorocentrum_lima.AAC.1
MHFNNRRNDHRERPLQADVATSRGDRVRFSFFFVRAKHELYMEFPPEENALPLAYLGCDLLSVEF